VDAGVSLRQLSEYQSVPYRPKWLAIAALLVVAASYVISMPLHWVGVVSPLGTYQTVTGIEQANWMLVAAVAVIAIAVRLMREPPGGYVLFFFVCLDFFISLGLYIEYIDNVGRAETDGFTPYLGPGFFVALAATAVFIAAGVFAWRERDG
jgi:predicted lysophospholipase L1 biosynthesis ABC-type transport system permease subunit